MNNGWIKIHRKILNNPISRKPKIAWLWIYLLLIANHETQEFMWNGGKQIVKRGQILTGRKELSSATGIKEGVVEGVLTYLEQGLRQIQQQKTTKFRLITVLNYEQYQGGIEKTDNKLTTKRQQNDTNKNDKNVKNDKKDIADKSADPVNEILNEFYKINPTLNFGNKTQRQIITDLIGKWGLEKTLNTVKYAISIQTQKYAPVITTPLQLRDKMGDLLVYHEKEANKNTITVI